MNKSSAIEMAKFVLEKHGKPMYTGDLANEMLKAGWQTKAENPKATAETSVYKCDKFEKTGRSIFGLVEWNSKPPVAKQAGKSSLLPIKNQIKSLTASLIDQYENGGIQQFPTIHAHKSHVCVKFKGDRKYHRKFEIPVGWDAKIVEDAIEASNRLILLQLKGSRGESVDAGNDQAFAAKRSEASKNSNADVNGMVIAELRSMQELANEFEIPIERLVNLRIKGKTMSEIREFANELMGE